MSLPRAFLVAACLASSLPACGGAGPYGHARVYVPLDEEQSAAAGARSYEPIFARTPDAYPNVRFSLFGVVTRRGIAAGKHADWAYVHISLRGLEPANLCARAGDASSCRVTVSDSEFGDVPVLVKLSVDDDVGEHAVGPGSLLRVIGTLGSDFDSTDNTPIVRATYYRHWPRGTFVTRAAATQLRQ